MKREKYGFLLVFALCLFFCFGMTAQASVIKADLNGDGRKETIRTYEDEESSYLVYINGKRVLRRGNYGNLWVNVVDFNKSDRYKELLVNFSEKFELYRYQNNRLVRYATSIYSGGSTSILKAQGIQGWNAEFDTTIPGNGRLYMSTYLVAKVNRQSFMIPILLTYKVQGGKFVLDQSRYQNVRGSCVRKVSNAYAYKSPTSKKKAFLCRNVYVKFIRARITAGSVYIQVARGGKYGWLYCGKPSAVRAHFLC